MSSFTGKKTCRACPWSSLRDAKDAAVGVIVTGSSIALTGSRMTLHPAMLR